MRLKPEFVPDALKKNLAAVYLISGDEPLQVCELADAIRHAATKAGYQSREIFFAETGFEWNQLAFFADSRSLLSDKKIIDLRLPSGVIGNEGAKALSNYCKRLPDDTLLLITAGKLAKDALKSAWLGELDKVGVIIQVWPLEGQDLIRWLQQRMLQRGLQTDSEGLKALALRIEGNLLAAAQEIEKLYVLYGAGKLDSGQIIDVVADSSRYDVFKLSDCLLSGNAKRIYKILKCLQAEGIAEPLVLWAITRETRSLVKIKSALTGGQNKELVFKNNQIWDKRKQLTENALNRLSDNELNNILLLSAKADRQIKGQQSGDAWKTLLTACLLFASVKAFASQ